MHALKLAFLSPLYLCLAAVFTAVPGIRFRVRCFTLGVRALCSPKMRLPLTAIFDLLFLPMDSTRYFEFDFAWEALVQFRTGRYLDISSPRLLPVALLDRNPGLTADLINPDRRDLADTTRLVSTVAASKRCTLHNVLIADAAFPAGTFDVITSISVLEHIPEDVAALQRMWSFLKPGGTLVLTVPCMARASEQFIDRNEWGVLGKDQDGQFFWQRFYDRALLEDRIFNVIGEPQRLTVFGEKVAGSFLANAMSKRSDPYYPYWREPYMVGREYQYFDSIDELPGEGVVGMVFVKPQ